MLLLSKYSVLEYLLWIKHNRYNDVKYSEFHQDLEKINPYQDLNIEAQILDVSVDTFKGGTRNLLFIFTLKGKQYILKQFRVSSLKEGNHFDTESFVLSTEGLSFLPTVVFIDKINFIIIEKFYINFNDFEEVFKEFIKNGQEKNINQVLIKVASNLKKFHQHADLKNRKYIVTKTDMRALPAYQIEFLKYYQNYTWDNDSFIHTDLNVRNMIFNNVDNQDIKIIDWEMSEIGDKYYDLCTIVKSICVCSLSSFFFVSYGDSKQINQKMKFAKIKKRVQIFLNAYDNQIDMEKLEAFFVINNSSEYKPDNKAFFTNINALFN